MKKLMIALAFAGMGTVAVNAQTTIETPTVSKYTVATNSFWSNWFIQVGADMAVQNPYGSNFFKNDWHDGRSYGVDLAIGKAFTPGLALRLKANWENGLIEREHNNPAKVPYGLTPNFDKGGYGTIVGDVMFNLSNLFCGYSDTRVWNFSLYPRAGVYRDFSNSKSYSGLLGVGAESSWRLGKHVGIYLDLAYNMLTGHNEGEYGYNTDGYFVADLGLTFYLGKATFHKAVTLEDYNALAAASEEAIARLRADLDREKALNADLRAQLAKWANHKCPEVTPAKIIQGAASSVFFDINSSKLNSKKDLINLESVAASAKNSDAKILVVGCADSKTGSDAYNQQLSEARAQAVADELVNLGVNRDNIEVKGIGGVAEVEPYNLNRRAVISFK